MFWQLCTVLWITWRLLEGVEHCGRNSGVEKEKDHNDGRYYSALFQITFKHFLADLQIELLLLQLVTLYHLRGDLFWRLPARQQCKRVLSLLELEPLQSASERRHESDCPRFLHLMCYVYQGNSQQRRTRRTHLRQAWLRWKTTIELGAMKGRMKLWLWGAGSD